MGECQCDYLYGDEICGYCRVNLYDSKDIIAELASKLAAYKSANVLLAKKVDELESERSAISDYCWARAGGTVTYAGDIFRYLNQNEPLPAPPTDKSD